MQFGQTCGRKELVYTRRIGFKLHEERRLFRRLMLTVALTAGCVSANSETFLERELVIVDGRPSKDAPAPLVVALHGFLGNASNMQGKTGFDRLSKSHGFVVVYPNGKRRRWNDGRSARNRTDDVSYLSSLIEKLIADGTADPGRIFLAGHSNGGGMSMRMACDRPDLISSIAVIATKSATAYPCAKGEPVSALFVHGTEDPISPHNGRPDGSLLGGTLSGRETIDLWQQRNRCSDTAHTETIDRLDDDTSLHISEFTDCAAALTYVLITGHGHDWPRPGNKKTRLQGPASQEVDATVLAWRFFEDQ